MKNRIEFSPAFDALKIFFDYITRRLKKNTDYVIHPLIRAFMNATDAIAKVKVGETTMGLSHNGNANHILNPYAVVLKKTTDDIIEILDIKNLKTDVSLPFNILVIIFRLQVHLDKIEEDSLTANQTARVLNKIMPFFHFYTIGSKWKKARELFLENLNKGKIATPLPQDLLEELNATNDNTPWEDYSPRLRTWISTPFATTLDRRSATIIITSPDSDTIGKAMILDMAVQFAIGEYGYYFKEADKCILCDYHNYKDNLLKSSNEFLIIADPYPILRGHILVIPRIHVRALGDLTAEHLFELEDLIENINKFYNNIYEYTIFCETGFQGQSIYHAHLHVLPGEHALSPIFSQYCGYKTKLKRYSDVIDFYKKYGSYLLWMDKDGLFCGTFKKQPPPEFFRKIIKEKILKSKFLRWGDYKYNNTLVELSKIHVNETKSIWNY